MNTNRIAASLLGALLAPIPYVLAQENRPPIPIRFALSGSGFVTLVIEDEQGRRVSNLVSETEFPAGENVVWWDGTDDAGRLQTWPNAN